MELVQVHHVRSVERSRYVEDAETGGVRIQRVQRFIASDTDRIAHPEYGTFEVQDDGSFYVPRPVAEHFLRQPDWHSGPSPFAPEVQDEKPKASRARKPVASEA
jgi:hypothetical protein